MCQAYRRRWLHLTAGLIVLAAVVYPLPAGPANINCPSTTDATVVVDTKQHTLALCHGGTPAELFRVRLGKHGVAKTREGDGKTPLGKYALGAPVPSQRFGTFIPIGYPTLEQRKLGYTGSAVGVHGPLREVRWLGRWVNAIDTTDGCVGIATDAEMKRITDFVVAHGARAIAIR